MRIMGEAESIPHGEWILVKDRLPNKHKKVLVQTLEDEIEVAEFSGYGETTYWKDGKEYTEKSPRWWYSMGRLSSKHPKAWMPLPKLYKAERGE